MKGDTTNAQQMLECLLLKVGEGQFGSKISMMWNNIDQRVTLDTRNNQPLASILDCCMFLQF